ncbi:MAG TPA: biotin/lipoyl-containing protein [Gemmatimonadales bacterium]|nr:biotin/lipoyl-containing protein [Gemmatimonadales bacterium]
MKYFVQMGEREVVVEVDGDRVTAEGRSYVAHLGPIPGTPLRHLLLGERSVELPVEPAGRGRWAIGLGGERREVEVLDERARHIRNLTGGGPSRRGAGALRAPMPGLVVRVAVTEGQSVAAGAGVVVLEAMKMENELKTAGPGVVKAVRVKPGEAVEKGQVLVEFEEAVQPGLT